MNDTQRRALTACMELAYNFAKTDYIAGGMVNDEALRESMKAVLEQTQIKLTDFTKMMLKKSGVFISPNVLDDFMKAGNFGKALKCHEQIHTAVQRIRVRQDSKTC